MNNFEAERRFAQRMKDNYPPGTRIMLLQMGDDPRPIEPNTRGTVRAVDDTGTLHCDFDSGRQLGVVPGEDSFRRLTEQELAEEQEMSEAQDFGMKMQYLYPQNLKATANLWLWGLRDFCILGIAALLSIVALVQLRIVLPAAATLCYGFLTIRLDDTTILDFMKYAVRYFISTQQYYEWR